MLPCSSLSPGICSDSCPWSWWCYLSISSSSGPFFCPQSVPASRSFPVSQLFASGGQSIGALASSSVLPMNNQDLFPLGLTGLNPLQSKGLSRIFSSTTVQKHQLFSSQPCLWFISHIHAGLLEKPQPWSFTHLPFSHFSSSIVMLKLGDMPSNRNFTELWIWMYSMGNHITCHPKLGHFWKWAEW